MSLRVGLSMLSRLIRLDGMRDEVARHYESAPGHQHAVRLSDMVARAVKDGVVSNATRRDVAEIAEECGWQLIRVGNVRLVRGVKHRGESVMASLRRSKELRAACRR